MFTKLAYIYGMKYLNGKIYKLIDNTNGNIYIGSTCKLLKERLKTHKGIYSLYNKKDGKCLTTSAYHIIKNNDYKIELLEYFPCKSKQELLRKEREYIESNKCINIVRPITTYQEKLDYRKEWYDKNKDIILEKQKIYNEANKDNLAEKRKEKYDKNKDIILEKQKIYTEANKDKIKERRSEKIQCDNCNNKITIYNLPRHKKSLKCKNYKKKD
jgi:hypothetical protein